MSAGLRTSLDSAIPIRLCGVDALVKAEVDWLEHERRAVVGTEGKPLAGPDALDALLAMPEGAEVPASSIDGATLTRLAAAEGALVHLSGGVVVRVCRPPATAALVSIPALDWRQGLQFAHRFAPYCARSIVLEREPRHAERLLLEASYWGIGVSVADDDPPRALLSPGRFSPSRYTGAAWWFDECLYAQVCVWMKRGAARQRASA